MATAKVAKEVKVLTGTTPFEISNEVDVQANFYAVDIAAKVKFLTDLADAYKASVKAGNDSPEVKAINEKMAELQEAKDKLMATPIAIKAIWNALFDPLRTMVDDATIVVLDAIDKPENRGRPAGSKNKA